MSDEGRKKTPHLPEYQANDFVEPSARRDRDDLPLEAIPSLPDDRLRSRRSTSPFLLAALFVILAAVLVIVWVKFRPDSGPLVAEGPTATPVGSPVDDPQPGPADGGTPAQPAAATPATTPATGLGNSSNDVTAPSFDRLAAKVRELQQSLAANEQQLEETRADLEEERQARQKAGSELTSLHRQMNQVQRNAEKKESELRTRLGQAEAQIAQINTDLAQTRQEKDGLSADLDKSRAESTRLIGELQKANKQQAEAETRAQRAVSQSRKTAKETQEILKSESEATRQLMNRLEVVRREKADEVSKRQQAESRITKLEQDLRTVRARFDEERARVNPGDLVPLSDDMLAPQRTRTVDPRYPSDARQRGVTGRVVVRALVSETGNVMRVEVVRSPDQALSDAASEAVMKFRYSPALKKGVPVKTWVTEAIEFR